MKQTTTLTKELLEVLIDELYSVKEDYKRTEETLNSMRKRIETLNNMIDHIKVQDKEANILMLKDKYPNAILLFRCGDFYECYKDDALNVSKVLGLVKNLCELGTCVGFPYFSLDEYLPKLIRAGYRVAICDEIK